jgi:hypothetical protein
VEANQKQRLLVAVRPHGVERLTNVLASDFTLIFCHTITEVQQHLTEDIDAVVCGTNFDESRMFDLLRYVKASPTHNTIPFVCIKVLEGVLNEATYASVKKASTLLGAAAFFDLAQARHDVGKDKAARALRSTLHLLMNQAA